MKGDRKISYQFSKVVRDDKHKKISESCPEMLHEDDRGHCVGQSKQVGDVGNYQSLA